MVHDQNDEIQYVKPLSSAIRVAAAVDAVKRNDQLELGRIVVEELEQYRASSADLDKFADHAGCSVRRLRYAAGVCRLVDRLRLTAEDVERLGWTKLAIVADASDEIATKSELENLCAGRTVTELRAVVSGTAGVVKTVVFTLNKGQRAALEAALLQNGARKSGRRLLNKEEALMKIVSAAVE